MILIAESGSTKTCWILYNSEGVKQRFNSGGLNPYTQKREQISEIIKNEVCPSIIKHEKPQHIYFYGAGCSTDENKKLIFSCLKSFFNKAEIDVEHDLLACARAVYSGKPVLSAIFGTGSNLCLYDGILLEQRTPSLGYILGDEGSGAYMGKLLIRDFLYNKMPKDLQDKLRVEYLLDKELILNHIYKMPDPNRWLASFSYFIRENIKEEYCKNLVRQSFKDFFNVHVMAFADVKNIALSAVGSIAFHYQDFLKEVAAEFDVKISKIIKSPMDELVKYHKVLMEKV